LITALSQNIPLVNEKGYLNPIPYNWMLEVSNLGILQGSGSPEGVVVALPTRLYMDIAGASGSILYIKRDTDVGGDRSQGWILV